MSSKDAIIILSPGFPKSETDSTCLPMQQQFVRTLKEMHPQFEIIVLTFQYPYHQQEYKWFDIKVVPFGGRNKGGLQKLLLRNKINSTLNKIYRERKRVVLFSFWYNECAFLGKKFADKHRINHYCWILGQDARRRNKYPGLLSPRSTELVALSDFIQKEFETNHGVKPGFVVPPGIDESLFEIRTTQKDIDILGVGSLIPLKQYDIFLEIIAEIKKQIPGIKASIVGKGPEKERLQSLISKLGLENSVRMRGELPYNDVIKLMQRAKVFLHTSSYEGFGCVCLEALYAGAHVISFCKPMDMQITHWHIAKDKEKAIEKALTILIDPHTEYVPVNGFDIKDTVTALIRLFEVT